MLMVPGEIGKDVTAKRMRQHHEGHGPAPELTLVELSNVFLKPLVNQLVGTPFPGGIFRQRQSLTVGHRVAEERDYCPSCTSVSQGVRFHGPIEISLLGGFQYIRPLYGPPGDPVRVFADSLHLALEIVDQRRGELGFLLPDSMDHQHGKCRRRSMLLTRTDHQGIKGFDRMPGF